MFGDIKLRPQTFEYIYNKKWNYNLISNVYVNQCISLETQASIWIKWNDICLDARLNWTLSKFKCNMDKDNIPDICDDDIDNDGYKNLIWIIKYENPDCSIWPSNANWNWKNNSLIPNVNNVDIELLEKHIWNCSLDNAFPIYNPDQMDLNMNGIGDVFEDQIWWMLGNIDPLFENNNDIDWDWISDNLDLCPEIPENYNLFQDWDGCPEIWISQSCDIRLQFPNLWWLFNWWFGNLLGAWGYNWNGWENNWWSVIWIWWLIIVWWWLISSWGIITSIWWVVVYSWWVVIYSWVINRSWWIVDRSGGLMTCGGKLIIWDWGLVIWAWGLVIWNWGTIIWDWLDVTWIWLWGNCGNNTWWNNSWWVVIVGWWIIWGWGGITSSWKVVVYSWWVVIYSWVINRSWWIVNRSGGLMTCEGKLIIWDWGLVIWAWGLVIWNWVNIIWDWGTVIWIWLWGNCWNNLWWENNNEGNWELPWWEKISIIPAIIQSECFQCPCGFSDIMNDLSKKDAVRASLWDKLWNILYRVSESKSLDLNMN